MQGETLPTEPEDTPEDATDLYHLMDTLIAGQQVLIDSTAEIARGQPDWQKVLTALPEVMTALVRSQTSLIHGQADLRRKLDTMIRLLVEIRDAVQANI